MKKFKYTLIFGLSGIVTALGAVASGILFGPTGLAAYLFATVFVFAGVSFGFILDGQE